MKKFFALPKYITWVYDGEDFGLVKVNTNNYHKVKDYCFLAPTQSLLQKWLREIHNIHIEPQLSRNSNDEYKNWWFYLYPNLNSGRIKFFPSEIGESLTYEEALEIGLQEGLKLIK